MGEDVVGDAIIENGVCSRDDASEIMMDKGSGAKLPFFMADLPVVGVFPRDRVEIILSAGDLLARVLPFVPVALAVDAVPILTVFCPITSTDAALFDLCGFDTASYC